MRTRKSDIPETVDKIFSVFYLVAYLLWSCIWPRIELIATKSHFLLCFWSLRMNSILVASEWPTFCNKKWTVIDLIFWGFDYYSGAITTIMLIVDYIKESRSICIPFISNPEEEGCNGYIHCFWYCHEFWPVSSLWEKVLVAFLQSIV